MADNKLYHYPAVCHEEEIPKIATGVSVYAVIDVSPSMRGSKILEVCTSIRDIIESCPAYVLFDISAFNHSTRKLVTALKSGVNVDKIIEEIKAACEEKGATALYDAWADMMLSIPDSVLRNDEVQIFVLTDGEDNSSKKYNLQTATEITSRVITSKTKFNFVQVGKAVNANVVESLKTISNKSGSAGEASQVTALVVDDSAKGIKDAMKTVHADIMMSTRKAKPNPNVVDETPAATATPTPATVVKQKLPVNPMLSTTKKPSTANKPA